MATSAALISYPCFEVLEKSNVSFVESTPQQRKCRKSRCDKKEKLADKNLLQTENYIAEYRYTSNSENATNNLLKTKTKDVKILPTLEENEEKEAMTGKVRVVILNYCSIPYIKNSSGLRVTNKFRKEGQSYSRCGLYNSNATK